MLIGHKLPEPYPAWRFVEGDLHDIARRVQEYADEARLVRNENTGQLGLAVWYRQHQIEGGAFTLARELFDLETDKPLVGEPDARVLRCMRAYDSRRVDMNDWFRRVAEAEKRREARNKKQSVDLHGDHAEQYVHRYGKDMGATNKAFFPDRERVVA